MDRNYWLGRWQRGETGWHQREVEPNLISHFSDLRPTRVFVPLCGKSLDLIWLASRGHEVIGIELSEMACREFFSGNQIPYQESSAGAFKKFQGGGVTIYNGDFFELRPQDLGKLGAVYDRAALIALPKELRARYATQMIQLLADSPRSAGFQFIQIVLERTPQDDQGPPFSISSQELTSLYEQAFQITPLSRESVEMRDSSPAKTEECVYSLKVP